MKKIKTLTIVLAIVLITMIGFCGIYTQVQNRMENQVKDYTYAMDLKGSRNVRLTINKENKTIIKDAEGNIVKDAETENLTDEQIAEKGYSKEETPYNKEEVKTIENYKASKKIIEERLKKLEVDNYIIKVDESTGDILLELTEDDKTDSVISNLTSAGKFEIVDTQTQELLLSNKDIKTAKVMYGTGDGTSTTGTSVYLEIEFNKEGSKKLEEISNKYITTEEEKNEENAEETTEKKKDEKTITMNIDDSEIMSTSFDEPIRTGKLQLSVGTAATDNDTLQDYINRATSMATILDKGNMPIKYDLKENQYKLSDITQKDKQMIIYVALAVIVLALIVIMIKYKGTGILGAISYIGFTALYLLILRYTNVVISIEGIFGIGMILVLNYIFLYQLLAKENKKEVYKKYFITILPIIIMVIAFCFIKWIPIASFGMVMFWGILLIAIYNAIVTNNLLKIKEGKE